MSLERSVFNGVGRRLCQAQLHTSTKYRLKCGLEIHTQLKTRYKLFSLSHASSDSSPNLRVSYFDCAIPGTQPRLNPEALLLALKAAVAFSCQVQRFSQFDRKHYFYLDQPLGYQITQHYKPIAKNGYLKLTKKFDGIKKPEKVIRFEQIQLEQDTGKTVNSKFDKLINIDLNRADMPLIEVVTKPDFETIDEVKAFLKKFQGMVKHLDICTGELETGAMRVDLNVSVNNGNRVEIKNLGSSSEIIAALKSEFQRQTALMSEGFTIPQETRGWNGKETVRLRAKESSVDYRYVPDSELHFIRLHPDIEEQIALTLPEFPEELISKLIEAPYNLELKHAKFLVDRSDILNFYLSLFQIVVQKNRKSGRVVNNWLVHNLLGVLNKSSLALGDLKLTPEKAASLIIMNENSEISSTSVKQLLKILVLNPEDRDLSFTELIKKYDLKRVDQQMSHDLDEALEEVCLEIIEENPDVVEKILKGKHTSLKYLMGLAMKVTQGKVNYKIIEAKMKSLLERQV